MKWASFEISTASWAWRGSVCAASHLGFWPIESLTWGALSWEDWNPMEWAPSQVYQGQEAVLLVVQDNEYSQWYIQDSVDDSYRKNTGLHYRNCTATSAREQLEGRFETCINPWDRVLHYGWIRSNSVTSSPAHPKAASSKDHRRWMYHYTSPTREEIARGGITNLFSPINWNTPDPYHLWKEGDITVSCTVTSAPFSGKEFF